MGSFSQEPLDSSLLGGYGADPSRESGLFITLPRTKSTLPAFDHGPAVYDDPGADPLRMDVYLPRSVSEIEMPPMTGSLDPLFVVPSMDVTPLDDPTDSSMPCFGREAHR